MKRGLAGLVVLALLAAAPYVVASYATVMLTRILVIGLLAVTVALLTGIAGLPTLGQTAPFAVGAYTAAQLLEHDMTIGVVQLLAAAAAGALFALITAPLVVYARGVVVLMITLALGELASIAAGRLKSLTGGTDGLIAFTRMHPLPGLVDLDTDRAVYLYVLVVTAVLVVAVLFLLRSRFGTLLRAGRDNEARMRASGHPVTLYFAALYVIAGALAGVAGSLLVVVDQYVSPADSGFSLSALVLLAVVIGGATSITGAFFGAALVVVTRDWLAGAGQAPLVLGAVFVICVYVLPEGLFAGQTAAALSSIGARLGLRRTPVTIPLPGRHGIPADGLDAVEDVETEPSVGRRPADGRAAAGPIAVEPGAAVVADGLDAIEDVETDPSVGRLPGDQTTEAVHHERP